MGETTEITGNLPAIVLFSLWWAFLTLEFLFKPPEAGEAGHVRPEQPADIAVARASDLRPADFRELDPEIFLSGARRAYEIILEAYAAGDLARLRPILSAEVMDIFASACSDRMEKGHRLEFALIGFRSVEIVDTTTTSETIEATVRFCTEIIRAEHGASGEVVSGDPAAVVVANDLWTFARPAAAGSDGWRIVATDNG